jgi:hypothetical protein
LNLLHLTHLSLSRTELALLLGWPMGVLGLHLEGILMLNLWKGDLTLHGHILPWRARFLKNQSRSPAACSSRVQSDKTTKAMIP